MKINYTIWETFWGLFKFFKLNSAQRRITLLKLLLELHSSTRGQKHMFKDIILESTLQ